MRPPAVFLQEKKAYEQIRIRIYEKIHTFICFSKKTPVLGRCAASGGFCSGKKAYRKNNNAYVLEIRYIYLFF